MADAQKTYTYITHTGIELHLSLDEAKTLAQLIYKTGGNPDDSARKHVDEIGRALSRADVHPANYFFAEGSILFHYGLKPRD